MDERIKNALIRQLMDDLAITWVPDEGEQRRLENTIREGAAWLETRAATPVTWLEEADRVTLLEWARLRWNHALEYFATNFSDELCAFLIRHLPPPEVTG